MDSYTYMPEIDAALKLTELEWIVEQLSLFFTDKQAMEPVAVSMAITRLLNLKARIDGSEAKRMRERDFGGTNAAL